MWLKRALLNQKEYQSFTWWESFMAGHISLGPVTIFGENAMHWAVNIRTKRWGYICFRLPFRCFGRWWPMYFYISPNTTPWASTFCIPKSYKDR